MARNGEDRTRSLAEQSVNTSIVHPIEGGPEHRKQDDPSTGRRSLTGNDQREGLEKTDPGTSRAGDRSRP